MAGNGPRYPVRLRLEYHSISPKHRKRLGEWRGNTIDLKDVEPAGGQSESGTSYFGRRPPPPNPCPSKPRLGRKLLKTSDDGAFPGVGRTPLRHCLVSVFPLFASHRALKDGPDSRRVLHEPRSLARPDQIGTLGRRGEFMVAESGTAARRPAGGRSSPRKFHGQPPAICSAPSCPWIRARCRPSAASRPRSGRAF
jgi:hypothetical protein